MRHGAAWVIGSRVAGIGVAMLLQMALARTLPPADMGHFSLLSTVTALGSLLAMRGTNAALLRVVPQALESGRDREAARFLRWASATAGRGALILAAAVIFFWPSVADWWQIPRDRSLAVLVALSLIALAVVQFAAESLRSLHELRFASLLTGGQTGGLLVNALFLGLLLLASREATRFADDFAPVARWSGARDPGGGVSARLGLAQSILED